MSKRSSRVRYLVVLLVSVGLALLINASPAAAHNELIASDPPEGAKIATSPARVSLTFNLPVQPGFSTVTVTGPDNSQWPAGPPTEAGAVVSAPLRPLESAGQYTIAYQVLSADGHPVRGVVRFTLTNPDPGTAAAAAPAQRPTDRSTTATSDSATADSGASSSIPVWLWLAGAGVAAVVGVVVAQRIRRSG
jgi:copper resistance protein C